MHSQGRRGSFAASMALARGAYRQERFWLGLILAVTFALYAPTLRDWFWADDFIFLRASRFASLPQYIRDAFDFTGYTRHKEFIDFVRDTSIALPFLSYRPLYFISLRIMYAFFGTDPTGYHLVCLTVHLINTVLVWRIATRLVPRAQALIAAAIFALHPVGALSVSWISDFATPLSVLGALAALLFLFKSLESERVSAGWYGAAIAAYLAAVFTHQQTITWAAVYIAAIMFVSVERQRQGCLDRWRWMVPFGAIALAVLLFQRHVANSESNTISHQTLTYFKNYLSNSVYPLDFENAKAQFAAFVAMIGILVALPTITLLKYGLHGPGLTVLFLTIWFLVALAPLTTLSISAFAGAGPGVFARKTYVILPSLALLFAVLGGFVAEVVPQHLEKPANIAVVVLLLLILAGDLKVANDQRADISDLANQYQHYTDQMLAAVPSLPEGGTLFVVGPPPPIAYFPYVFVSSVQAFYGRVDAQIIDPKTAAELQTSLPPGDAIFYYVAQ